MFRPLPVILIGASLCLSACASRDTALQSTPLKNSTAKIKGPVVITVAKDGAINVDRQPVPLKNLAVTLKGMGLTKDSKFKIEGETGTAPKEIDQVLETLVDNGFLPKNTID